MTGRWVIAGAILAACFQTVMLLWMIESRASVLRNGTEITLKTEPVDPRDLLRGKYVRLNYDISSVSLELADDPSIENLKRGAVVFVTLSVGDDGRAVAQRLSRTYPTSIPENAVVSRANIRRFTRATAGSGAARSAGKVLLSFGVERFFVPEGDAVDIETKYRDEKTPVDVVVAVGSSGEMQIKRLIINGLPAYEEPHY